MTLFAHLTSLAFLGLTAHAAPTLNVYSWDTASRTDTYAEWLGRPVMMGQSHQIKDGWARVEGEGWAMRPWSTWVNAAPGRTLNLSVVMIPWGENLGQCAAGAYDAHYTKLAQNLVAHKLEKSVLRLGWEFSGGWMPWSSNGQEANFAACFRRMVNAMRAVPGTQLKFDWNPNADIPAKLMEPTYPGDAYVDYIGLDLYDVAWAANTFPYPVPCDDACRLTRQKNAWNSFQAPALANFLKFSKAHQKPLSIPEWGLIDDKPGLPGGGDNPFYIKNMLDFIFDPAHNVGYASYFDVDTGENNIQLSDIVTGGAHTKVTKAPVSAALFRTMVRAALKPDGSWANPPAPPALALTNVVSVDASYTVGTKAKVTATLTANRDLAGLNLTAQLSDPGGKVYAEGRVTSVNVKNGIVTPVAIAIDVPATLAPGTYRVNVLTYDSAWKSLNYQGGPSFAVKAAATPPSFAAVSRLDSDRLAAGATLKISSNVTATLEVRRAILNYKIATEGGEVVGETTVTGVTLAANAAETVDASFRLPSSLPPGKYKVILVVYDVDWKVLSWRDAAVFTVTAP